LIIDGLRAVVVYRLMFLHEVFLVTDPKTSPRGLDIDQVRARLGGEKPLDPSTVWRRTKNDPDFPRPFYLWNAAPRWVEEEVDDYIRKKIAERDDPACAAAQRERRVRWEQRVKEPRARALKRAQEAKARKSRRRSKTDLQAQDTS
jgi:predicted DNA-binding transcriptional regulator AlpA